METFIAENGGTVRVIQTATDGERTVVSVPRAYNLEEGGSSTAHLIDDQVGALREFFLAERDQELGRWRSNIHPDVVAYPLSEDLVRVFTEVTGNALGVSRGERDSWSEPGEQVEMLNSVGDEYFAAHPAPKPWHDAKPGEVWVLEMDGEERAFMLDSVDHFDHYGSYYEKDDPRITEGRRIWPEVPSE